MAKKRKPLTLSKRKAGFAIKLSGQQRFMIHAFYPWLQQQGVTDSELDEAKALVEEPEVPADELRAARLTGVVPSFNYRTGFYKARVFRVRAEDIQAVARLFRLIGSICVGGQVGSTLIKRAQDLENVSVLDKLVDAQRGSSDESSLILRD